MSGTMMNDLYRIVNTELPAWKEGVGVVIRGASNFFCSGADIKLATTYINTPERGGYMCDIMTESLNGIRQLPLISVAAIGLKLE